MAARAWCGGHRDGSGVGGGDADRVDRDLPPGRRAVVAGTGSPGPSRRRRSADRRSSRGRGASTWRTGDNRSRRSAGSDWRWTRSAARPPNVGLLPLLYVGTARAHIQCGQIDQARAVLQHAHAHPVGHPVADEVRNRGVAAFVAAHDGELVEAAATRPRRRGVGRPARPRTLRARADLRRPGDGRGAPRAQRAGARPPARSRASRADAEREPSPDGAGRRGPAARQAGPLRSVTWPVPRPCSPRPGCRLPRARRRRASGARRGGGRAGAAVRSGDGAASLIGELDPDRVATRVLTARLALLEPRRPARPPGCWPSFRRRPPGGPGSSGRCCVRSACSTATSIRPTAISVRRSSTVSRSG